MKSAAKYVEEQYAGAREKLRPIFEELLKLGRSMGDDVKVCPCKTIVPLYREHVVAQIKPTTNSRVDFGLALTHYKGKLPKRLVDTGGAGQKRAYHASHRTDFVRANRRGSEEVAENGL